MGSIVFFHLVNDLILRNEKEKTIYTHFERCINDIPAIERDSIFNYNLFWHGYNMMEHQELLQCNRVSLAFNLPSLMKEESEKPLSMPKWIMVSFELGIYDYDIHFIRNNYELVHQFHYDRLYFQHPKIGKSFNVCFFRRKD